MSRMSRIWAIAAALMALECARECRAQQVTPLSEQGLDSLLEHRAGRPLVLNLWATWCEPCREEFPDLLKVAPEFPGVDAAALSVDYPDEIDSKIRPFLRTLTITLPVFVSAAKTQDRVINRLSGAWNGALPATFIYSSKGEPDTFYVGKRTLAQFRSAFRRAASLR
jgi:thiol-disulfide isomerase/thioredoxin